jgi:hypothetical protein
MSYASESLKPRTEKITLITADSVERVKLFTLSGGDYYRAVNYFVVGVKKAGVSLSAGTLPLSVNQYYFDAKNKKLWVNVGADPKTADLSVTYRHFFSSAPVILPYDLSSGEAVEWRPIVQSIGTIGQQLDEENVGIVLESSSSVNLINRDGFFDNIFDSLIWENQAIKFYSWIASTPITDKITLFDGVIESKDYSEASITFRVKDFVYKLQNTLNLGLFSESDGSLLPSIVGTPKRRIYGQVDKCKIVSLDATLNGFALTGTLDAAVGATTLTGTGTSFLSQVSPGDELIVVYSGQTYKLGVDSIASDTSLVIGSALSFALSASTALVSPKIPYRLKNRTWHVAGHKLRAPSTTISSFAGIYYTVADTTDFFANDAITVNGVQATIRRISDNKIVTQTDVSNGVSVGNTIAKLPISAVYFGPKLLTYSRDYTITNSTEAKIVLDPLAEFNIAQQTNMQNTLSFTNGSRTVTTAASVDLRTFLNSRDWIRSGDIAEPTWYEILQVTQQTILLRTAFTGATATKAAYYKNVEYISEDSLVTVDCVGMESGGVWMRTASDAVRHLVLNDAGFSAVNETTFAKAKAMCTYTLSMALPETIGGDLPQIRDVISLINDSVFGSLYGDSSQNISYAVLNATKPSIANILYDDDITSFTVQSSQKIINQAIISYAPYTDIYTGEAAFKVVSYTNSFVDNLIGIKNTLDKIVYLYEDDKALIVAQRKCLFNSLSSSTVKIKGKMNLAQILVNDKVFLSLDRLFKRYSGRDKRKLGTVTGVSRDGFNTEISISDLGNVYNRIMSIAPNTVVDYSTSSSDDKLRWAYILDSNTESPDATSEVGIGSCLIG